MYDVTKIPIPNTAFATTDQKGIESVILPGEEDRQTRIPQFIGVGSNTIRDQNTANIAAQKGLTFNPEASQQQGRAVFDNQPRSNDNVDGTFDDNQTTEIENDNSEINETVNKGKNVEEEENLNAEVELTDTNNANKVSRKVLEKLIEDGSVKFNAGSYVDDDGNVYVSKNMHFCLCYYFYRYRLRPPYGMDLWHMCRYLPISSIVSLSIYRSIEDISRSVALAYRPSKLGPLKGEKKVGK